MAKPVAVLISDIHFTVSTLDLAYQSLRKAQFKAKMLDVPLIICGDTLDSKAVVRAECMNKLLLMLAAQDKTPTYIMVGNHDMCNEKGTEHALNFLTGFCEVIAQPTVISLPGKEVMLIPYQTDVSNITKILEDDDTPDTLIMHQGVQGAWMGHYVQDKTSLPKEAFADFRVISGHYHRAQDIKCGRPRRGAVGLFSYIGNPYSLSFSEADDGPKGFQVLYDNGLMEHIPTNLRGHYVYSRTAEEALNMQDRGQKLDGPHYGSGKKDDLIWVKVTGPKSLLAKVDKKALGVHLGFTNYKLDLIPSDSEKLDVQTQKMTEPEILDTLIDATPESDDQKTYLKSLWREIME